VIVLPAILKSEATRADLPVGNVNTTFAGASFSTVADISVLQYELHD